MDPITIFSYRVPPERMKRLRYAPTSLTELAAVLNERGLDLLSHLRARLASAVAAGEPAAWRLNGRLAVIVEMPIVSPRGEQGAGIDMRAFVTPLSAGAIAVALGIALKQESRSEGSKVGYVRAIGAPPVGGDALAAIEVQSAEVHLEFERDLAAQLAGRNAPDPRNCVLVGAGAIGSHLADSLMREGRFAWTIIDDDRLLPHNLARHVSRNSDVSRPKAAIVADHLNAIIAGGKVAKAIPANLFDPGEGGAAVEHALSEADIIIDATASLVAVRKLSDHPSKARRMSAFFNPSGEAAVLLAEPEDRAVTLRDLEAQYLALVLRTPRLADHLGKLAETIAYTGACRAITNRIPEWRATILSGLAAGGIGYAVDTADGMISIWTLAPTGEVSLDTAPVEPVGHYQAMDWTITINAGLADRIVEMRNSCLPAETGGILFGLVDIPAKSIHLVMATPAPSDSIEEPGGFVRGMGGVDEMMEDVRRRTAGQVRYVGEWHSHPPQASARPSSTDGRQLDWLAALMGMDSMPALMLISADGELSVIFATRRAEPSSAPLGG
jgi:proteasome lid subunit RPN8/RPN11